MLKGGKPDWEQRIVRDYLYLSCSPFFFSFFFFVLSPIVSCLFAQGLYFSWQNNIFPSLLPPNKCPHSQRYPFFKSYSLVVVWIKAHANEWYVIGPAWSWCWLSLKWLSWSLVFVDGTCRFWKMPFVDSFFVIPLIVLLYFQLAEHRPEIPILEDAVQWECMNLLYLKERNRSKK